MIYKSLNWFSPIELYKSTELQSIASMWLLICKSVCWNDVAEDNIAGEKKNHVYCDHCSFHLHLSP